MDFSFINELIRMLEGNNIYQFSFTGAKILALGLLALKVLDMFVKENLDNQELKIGNLASILGYGLVIMSSDWIITTIENAFAGVDVAMQNTSSDLFSEMGEMVEEKRAELFKGAKAWYEYLGVFLRNLGSLLVLGVTFLLGALCKIADLSITASYLVQRIFILQLLKFLFPLAVALSTYSGTQKLFHTWILRYIGIFILGIAYIGIIRISSMVQGALVRQFDVNTGVSEVDGGFFAGGLLIAMIVTFTIKIKLFSTATSYVMGMFQ